MSNDIEITNKPDLRGCFPRAATPPVEEVAAPALAVYEGMNEVFEHTRRIIDVMQQGEKITVRDLVDKVLAEVKMPSGNVTSLVQMYLKSDKSVSVEIGRGGGVFKGGKPKRIDNRPRCNSCNQVLRPDSQKAKSNSIEEMAN
jgi:hypothetical protein